MNHKFIGLTTIDGKKWCEEHDKFERLVEPIGWAYIAGLFDGEGCISLYRRKDSRIEGFTLGYEVSIKNTNMRTLYAINGKVKGRLVEKSNGENSKKVYSLILNNLKGINCFLVEMVPYLLIKRHQAELMIDFCQSRLNRKGTKYTQQEIKIADKIRKLNKRGVKVQRILA